MKRDLWTPELLQQENSLRKQLSCKHDTSTKEKEWLKGGPGAQRTGSRAMESRGQPGIGLGPNQGTYSICLAGFQNCYHWATPLCLTFPFVSRNVCNGYPLVCHYCLLAGQETDLFPQFKTKNVIHLSLNGQEIQTDTWQMMLYTNEQ